MDTLTAVTEALKTGGPWTLLAIALYAIRYLYQAREKDQALHAKEKQDLNDRMLTLIKEQTAVITQANENQRKLIEAVSNLEVAE